MSAVISIKTIKTIGTQSILAAKVPEGEKKLNKGKTFWEEFAWLISEPEFVAIISVIDKSDEAVVKFQLQPFLVQHLTSADLSGLLLLIW